ncbi:hypothetical protein [Amycolatopsis sp. La24]|uniref:hypothetical protein n=1 Tax=Amycolatopsis sp. La24 TaxID=3028304 RepID=UPI00131B8732|nr:hypothetical protein [Amycolatopsis sp. La24]
MPNAASNKQTERILAALERDAELGLGGQAGRVLFALAWDAELGIERAGWAHTHRA